MSRRALFALVAALAAPGCLTIDTQMDASYPGPYVYSGVRKDLKMWPEALITFNIGAFVFSSVDFPFSLIGDTVLLPYTIPKDSALAAQQEEEQRVDVERVAAVQSREGESKAETAHRLFEECAHRLKAADPHFTDCYSIDAKIQIIDAAPTTGAEYKPELRKQLAHWKSSGETVEWRDPSFFEDGGQVRISAKRAVSTNGRRLPVSLLVGPSEEGAWRILEEISPGLGEP
ncbi:MAG TPA: YceK/YidQ family lipoprotein [Myxococcota bacterium]|nr:YceK/YidQ family lipoprotein [Myxococcota bacterium]